MLLSHPLYDFLSNELKDGALQHIRLGISLQQTLSIMKMQCNQARCCLHFVPKVGDARE